MKSLRAEAAIWAALGFFASLRMTPQYKIRNKSNDKSNCKSNCKSNDKSNCKSNDKSNCKSNDKSNCKSNDKSNDKSNCPTQAKRWLEWATRPPVTRGFSSG
jgi:hypothetical protein